jgi:hypothetical protein
MEAMSGFASIINFHAKNVASNISKAVNVHFVAK